MKKADERQKIRIYEYQKFLQQKNSRNMKRQIRGRKEIFQRI